MAKEDSRNFSYMDIMQNPVMTGKAVGKIWLGFPDVKYLDNDMVIIDEAQRKELIRRITELEKYTRNIRNTKKGFREDARVDSERLFVNLFENDYMNPDALAIAWVRTYQDIRNENSSEFFRIPQDAKRNLDILERSMKGKAFNTEVYDEKDGKYKVDGICTLDYEKKYIHTKNQRNLARLAQHMKQFYIGGEEYSDDELVKVLIERLNSHLSVSELKSIFPQDDNYTFSQNVVNVTFLNAMLMQGYGVSQIEEFTGEEITDIVTNGEINGVDSDGYDKLKLDTISEYIDYIDLDKYIINYIAKELIVFDNIGNYQFKKGDDDERNALDNPGYVSDIFGRMFYLKQLVTMVNKIDLLNRNTKISLSIGEKRIHFDIEKIREKMNQYSGDLYLTPKVYESIRPFLYNRDETIWGDNENLADLQISDLDKKLLIATDSRNAVDLYEAGVIDKEFIIQTLKEMKSKDMVQLYHQTVEGMNISTADEEALKSFQILYPSEITRFVLDKGIFSNDDIKLLYEQDVLNLENIENIGISEETLSNFVTDEQLIDTYRNYIKAMLVYRRDETPENKENLAKATLLKNKRMALYKKYKLEKMTPDERTENAEELILSYYSDLDLESQDDNILEALREMYKDRIVNFESINNSDPKMLQDLLIDVMLKRGELTLDDTIKLKRTFPIEKQKAIVEEALQDDDISENEKFILVMNMFFENTKEDTLARYEFLKRFRASQFVGELDPKFITTEVEPDENPNTDTKHGKQSWNKYVYSDNIKWILFMSIDKDAMPTRYDNGYVEFYLPKFNKRVIEKYHDVEAATHKIKGPAYGVATYIMSDETFRTENDDLVEITDNGGIAINERNLRKIVPRKDRVSHVTQSADRNWMRSLTEKLGIDFTGDTRYTKQELENLGNVIETYENCYERY